MSQNNGNIDGNGIDNYSSDYSSDEETSGHDSLDEQNDDYYSNPDDYNFDLIESTPWIDPPPDKDNLFPVDIDVSLWNKFSQNLLHKLNWDNCMVAGGSISKLYLNVDEESPLYKGSDIDIYLYGTMEEKIDKLNYLLNYFKYTVLIPYNNVYTLYFRGKSRNVQIVCGNFVNKYHIVNNFDYSHLEILYDGTTFWATKNFLDNIKENKTKYKNQSKVSEYRLYKTLLLNLNIVDYTQFNKWNWHTSSTLINASKNILDFKSEKDYFKSILDNKDFEKELNDSYYPIKSENLSDIKDTIIDIYIKKYNTNAILLREIINNRNLLQTINWEYGFETVINTSYRSKVDLYAINTFIYKLYCIIEHNDVYQLRNYKNITITNFKSCCDLDLKQSVYELISLACKKGTVEILFILYQIFKNILLRKKPEGRPSNLILKAYESGNIQTVRLIKSMVAKFYKYKIKLSKEQIYNSICLSGNIELFKLECNDPDYSFTITQIFNIYSSGNLNFIKHCTARLSISQVLRQSVAKVISIKHIRDIDTLKFCIDPYNKQYKYLATKSDISTIIKTKNMEMVSYILQFKQEALQFNQIFGFLCYLGNTDMIKFLLETESSLSISNISDYEEGAFRYACKSGNLDLVKYLLELKPDINIGAINNCALKYACEEGHLNILKYILELKPDIDLFRTAEWCEHCLDKGNKLLYINFEKNVSINNCSPFCYALKSKNLPLISYLITKDPSKSTVFKNILYIENEKIKKIQNWWKTLFYDPYSEYGKKQQLESYDRLMRTVE
jgi:hypothetical protein